jgi:uncharacterized repeat protein (TIGR03803 family)
MKRELWQVTIVLLAALVATVTLGGMAQASAEKVVYSFTGSPDGASPNAGVIFDAAGNVYGTTAGGGTAGLGTVFELSPNLDGTWTEKVIYSFQGPYDGETPLGSLIFDHAGNLYGTTYTGGRGSIGSGGGTVFELSPNTDGTWSETTLLASADSLPAYTLVTSLIFDTAGNLYSTSIHGGDYGLGNVFEMSPSGDGSWTANSIFSFPCCQPNSEPVAGLLIDSSGNLYGTTQVGNNGLGNVYELSASNGWKENYLHTFKGDPDGANPEAALIFDAAGNLYGTSVTGGTSSNCSCGTVFRLKPSDSGKRWTQTVLHSFNGSPGSGPIAGLVLDSANNLYGVTYYSGPENGYPGGLAFRINLTTGGYTVLHEFGGTGDGYGPVGTLTIGPSGNLFGTTYYGGGAGFGAVYELQP